MVTVILRNLSQNSIGKHAFLRLAQAAWLVVLLLHVAPAWGEESELRPPGGALRPASESRPATGLPSTLIELDGTSSVSPDGGSLAYTWKQVAGPKIELSDYHAAKPYFRTSQPGIYEFELVVEANGLKSEPHLVRLEIERENLPPVAKLYAEAWGQVGKVIEIDGRESFDPEGEKLTYRWRPLTPGLNIPPAALSQPVLAFEPVRDGVFEVELIVSDGEKVSAPVVCRISIKPRPKPPVAKVQVKTLKATLPGSASGELSAMTDAADAAAGKAGAGEKPAAPSQPAAAPLPPSLMDPMPFNGGSSAGVGQAASAGRTPGIAEAMSPLTPIAATNPGPTSPPAAVPVPAVSRQKPVARIEAPVVVKSGEMVMLDARKSLSPSSNRLEFLWRQKSGAFINDFELVFDGAAQRFHAPRPGDYEFELVVSDGGVDSAPAFHTLRVVKEEDPPVAVVVAPTRAMPGALVKLDATQSYDMAGTQLTYRWRQTGGPAVKNYIIDETLGDSAPAFHPPTAGVYSFELVVTNGKQNSKPIEIDIEVGDARLPPSLSIAGPEVATSGEQLYLTVNVEDYDASAASGLAFVWHQAEGPANALMQSQGVRGLVTPPLPGRYVFDVSAMEHGRVVAKTSRVLEVFKGGDRPASASAYIASDTMGMMPPQMSSLPPMSGQSEMPVVLPPQPMPVVEEDYGMQRRVVPELTPAASSTPPPTSFPDPQSTRGKKRTTGRKPAQVLQSGKSKTY